jgi:alanine racemase
MNRLGIGVGEFNALINAGNFPRDLNILYLMSHYACADERDHPMTARQCRDFADVKARLETYLGHPVPSSLANSSGLFRDHSSAYDLARPGMALYGLNPTPEAQNPMRAVVRIDARVLQVRRAPMGETVGYAASHTLSRESMIATIGIGYADGFPRHLSNGGNGTGRLYYRGHACPILGRVSMDLTVIDLTELPAGVPRPMVGDMVEVIGPNQSADDLATSAGTIGYEILTQLSRRAQRSTDTPAPLD